MICETIMCHNTSHQQQQSDIKATTQSHNKILFTNS